MRQLLSPTGTYKRRRSWNFLGKFTELNYKLKYVAGQGVLSYVNWEVRKEGAREGGRADGKEGRSEGGKKEDMETKESYMEKLQ